MSNPAPWNVGDFFQGLMDQVGQAFGWAQPAPPANEPNPEPVSNPDYQPIEWSQQSNDFGQPVETPHEQTVNEPYNPNDWTQQRPEWQVPVFGGLKRMWDIAGYQLDGGEKGLSPDQEQAMDTAKDMAYQQRDALWASMTQPDYEKTALGGDKLDLQYNGLEKGLNLAKAIGIPYLMDLTKWNEAAKKPLGKFNPLNIAEAGLSGLFSMAGGAQKLLADIELSDNKTPAMLPDMAINSLEGVTYALQGNFNKPLKDYTWDQTLRGVDATAATELRALLINEPDSEAKRLAKRYLEKTAYSKPSIQLEGVKAILSGKETYREATENHVDVWGQLLGDMFIDPSNHVPLGELVGLTSKSMMGRAVDINTGFRRVMDVAPKIKWAEEEVKSAGDLVKKLEDAGSTLADGSNATVKRFGSAAVNDVQAAENAAKELQAAKDWAAAAKARLDSLNQSQANQITAPTGVMQRILRNVDQSVQNVGQAIERRIFGDYNAPYDIEKAAQELANLNDASWGHALSNLMSPTQETGRRMFINAYESVLTHLADGAQSVDELGKRLEHWMNNEWDQLIPLMQSAKTTSTDMLRAISDARYGAYTRAVMNQLVFEDGKLALNKITDLIGKSGTPEEAVSRMLGRMGKAMQELVPSPQDAVSKAMQNSKRLANWWYIGTTPSIAVGNVMSGAGYMAFGGVLHPAQVATMQKFAAERGGIPPEVFSGMMSPGGMLVDIRNAGNNIPTFRQIMGNLAQFKLADAYANAELMMRVQAWHAGASRVELSQAQHLIDRLVRQNKALADAEQISPALMRYMQKHINEHGIGEESIKQLMKDVAGRQGVLQYVDLNDLKDPVLNDSLRILAMIGEADTVRKLHKALNSSQGVEEAVRIARRAVDRQLQIMQTHQAKAVNSMVLQKALEKALALAPRDQQVYDAMSPAMRKSIDDIHAGMERAESVLNVALSHAEAIGRQAAWADAVEKRLKEWLAANPGKTEADAWEHIELPKEAFDNWRAFVPQDVYDSLRDLVAETNRQREGYATLRNDILVQARRQMDEEAQAIDLKARADRGFAAYNALKKSQGAKELTRPEYDELMKDELARANAYATEAGLPEMSRWEWERKKQQYYFNEGMNKPLGEEGWAPDTQDYTRSAAEARTEATTAHMLGESDAGGGRTVFPGSGIEIQKPESPAGITEALNLVTPEQLDLINKAREQNGLQPFQRAWHLREQSLTDGDSTPGLMMENLMIDIIGQINEDYWSHVPADLLGHPDDIEKIVKQPLPRYYTENSQEAYENAIAHATDSTYGPSNDYGLEHVIDPKSPAWMSFSRIVTMHLEGTTEQMLRDAISGQIPGYGGRVGAEVARSRGLWSWYRDMVDQPVARTGASILERSRQSSRQSAADAMRTPEQWDDLIKNDKIKLHQMVNAIVNDRALTVEMVDGKAKYVLSPSFNWDYYADVFGERAQSMLPQIYEKAFKQWNADRIKEITEGVASNNPKYAEYIGMNMQALARRVRQEVVNYAQTFEARQRIEMTALGQVGVQDDFLKEMRAAVERRRFVEEIRTLVGKQDEKKAQDIIDAYIFSWGIHSPKDAWGAPLQQLPDATGLREAAEMRPIVEYLKERFKNDPNAAQEAINAEALKLANQYGKTPEEILAAWRQVRWSDNKYIAALKARADGKMDEITGLMNPAVDELNELEMRINESLRKGDKQWDNVFSAAGAHETQLFEDGREGATDIANQVVDVVHRDPRTGVFTMSKVDTQMQQMYDNLLELYNKDIARRRYGVTADLSERENALGELLAIPIDQRRFPDDRITNRIDSLLNTIFPHGIEERQKAVRAVRMVDNTEQLGEHIRELNRTLTERLHRTAVIADAIWADHINTKMGGMPGVVERQILSADMAGKYASEVFDLDSPRWQQERDAVMVMMRKHPELYDFENPIKPTAMPPTAADYARYQDLRRQIAAEVDAQYRQAMSGRFSMNSLEAIRQQIDDAPEVKQVDSMISRWMQVLGSGESTDVPQQDSLAYWRRELEAALRDDPWYEEAGSDQRRMIVTGRMDVTPEEVSGPHPVASGILPPAGGANVGVDAAQVVPSSLRAVNVTASGPNLQRGPLGRQQEYLNLVRQGKSANVRAQEALKRVEEIEGSINKQLDTLYAYRQSLEDGIRKALPKRGEMNADSILEYRRAVADAEEKILGGRRLESFDPDAATRGIPGNALKPGPLAEAPEAINTAAGREALAVDGAFGVPKTENMGEGIQRVYLTGPRILTPDDTDRLANRIASGIGPDTIVHVTDARGFDELVIQWMVNNGLAQNLHIHTAQVMGQDGAVKAGTIWGYQAEEAMRQALEAGAHVHYRPSEFTGKTGWRKLSAQARLRDAEAEARSASQATYGWYNDYGAHDMQGLRSAVYRGHKVMAAPISELPTARRAKMMEAVKPVDLPTAPAQVTHENLAAHFLEQIRPMGGSAEEAASLRDVFWAQYDAMGKILGMSPETVARQYGLLPVVSDVAAMEGWLGLARNLQGIGRAKTMDEIIARGGDNWIHLIGRAIKDEGLSSEMRDLLKHDYDVLYDFAYKSAAPNPARYIGLHEFDGEQLFRIRDAMRTFVRSPKSATSLPDKVREVFHRLSSWIYDTLMRDKSLRQGELPAEVAHAFERMFGGYGTLKDVQPMTRSAFRGRLIEAMEAAAPTGKLGLGTESSILQRIGRTDRWQKTAMQMTAANQADMSLALIDTVAQSWITHMRSIDPKAYLKMSDAEMMDLFYKQFASDVVFAPATTARGGTYYAPTHVTRVTEPKPVELQIAEDATVTGVPYPKPVMPVADMPKPPVLYLYAAADQSTVPHEVSHMLLDLIERTNYFDSKDLKEGIESLRRQADIIKQAGEMRTPIGARFMAQVYGEGMDAKAMAERLPHIKNLGDSDEIIAELFSNYVMSFAKAGGRAELESLPQPAQRVLAQMGDWLATMVSKSRQANPLLPINKDLDQALSAIFRRWGPEQLEPPKQRLTADQAMMEAQRSTYQLRPNVRTYPDRQDMLSLVGSQQELREILQDLGINEQTGDMIWTQSYGANTSPKTIRGLLELLHGKRRIAENEELANSYTWRQLIPTNAVEDPFTLEAHRNDIQYNPRDGSFTIFNRDGRPVQVVSSATGERITYKPKVTYQNITEFATDAKDGPTRWEAYRGQLVAEMRRRAAEDPSFRQILSDLNGRNLVVSDTTSDFRMAIGNAMAMVSDEMFPSVTTELRQRVLDQIRVRRQERELAGTSIGGMPIYKGQGYDSVTRILTTVEGENRTVVSRYVAYNRLTQEYRLIGEYPSPLSQLGKPISWKTIARENLEGDEPAWMIVPGDQVPAYVDKIRKITGRDLAGLGTKDSPSILHERAVLEDYRGKVLHGETSRNLGNPNEEANAFMTDRQAYGSSAIPVVSNRAMQGMQRQPQSLLANTKAALANELPPESVLNVWNEAAWLSEERARMLQHTAMLNVGNGEIISRMMREIDENLSLLADRGLSAKDLKDIRNRLSRLNDIENLRAPTEIQQLAARTRGMAIDRGRIPDAEWDDMQKRVKKLWDEWDGFKARQKQKELEARLAREAEDSTPPPPDFPPDPNTTATPPVKPVPPSPIDLAVDPNDPQQGIGMLRQPNRFRRGAEKPQGLSTPEDVREFSFQIWNRLQNGDVEGAQRLWAGENLPDNEVDFNAESAARDAIKPLLRQAEASGGMPTAEWNDRSFMAQQQSELWRYVADRLGQIKLEDLPARNMPEVPESLSLDVLNRALTDGARETTAYASQMGAQMADYALFSGKRYNADRVMDFIGPFHYYNTRALANWTQRVIEDPWMLNMLMDIQNWSDKWHKQQGDPEYMNDTVPIPGLKDAYFNWKKAINPLYQITNDFYQKDRSADLVGELMQRSPITPWQPMAWAYALSKRQSNPEAFRAWIGHELPGGAVLKGASALYKQAKLPGHESIPAGGIYPEGAVFPELGAGNLSEMRKAARVPTDMVMRGIKNPETGKPVTMTEALRAEYYKQGPLWDYALQQQATDMAGGALMQYIGLSGLSNYSPTTKQMDKAWDDWIALAASRKLYSSDALSKMYDDFNKQYPWFTGVRMATKSDVQNLVLFGNDVLQRLPPGSTNKLATSQGVSDLVQKYQSLNGTAEKIDWLNTMKKQSSYRYDQFKSFIEQMDTQFTIPSEDMKTEYQFGRALISEFFKLPEGDFKAQEQFRAKYPQLEQYMPAGPATKFWSEYSKLDPVGQNLAKQVDGLKAGGLLTVLDKATRGVISDTAMANLAEATRQFGERLSKMPAYAEYVGRITAMNQKFGVDVHDLESQYMAESKDNRPAFLLKHPELKEFWTWRDGYLLLHPELMAAQQNTGIDPVKQNATTAAGSYDPATVAYRVYMNEREQKFPNIIDTQTEYYNQPLGTRTKWLAGHPELVQYWKWKDDYQAAHPELKAMVTALNDANSPRADGPTPYTSAYIRSASDSLNTLGLSAQRNYGSYGGGGGSSSGGSGVRYTGAGNPGSSGSVLPLINAVMTNYGTELRNFYNNGKPLSATTQEGLDNLRRQYARFMTSQQFLSTLQLFFHTLPQYGPTQSARYPRTSVNYIQR